MAVAFCSTLEAWIRPQFDAMGRHIHGSTLLDPVTRVVVGAQVRLVTLRRRAQATVRRHSGPRGCDERVLTGC